MKRFLSCFLCLCMLFGIIACQRIDDPTPDQNDATDSEASSESATGGNADQPTDSEKDSAEVDGSESGDTEDGSAETESDSSEDTAPSTSESESAEGDNGGETTEGDKSETPPEEEDFAADDPKPLDNNFKSRAFTSFANINGKTVDVYTLYRDNYETLNNPNFSMAIMFWQCIEYKKLHPEADVKLTFTSYHVSVVVAACLNPDNPKYGQLKNLYDSDYTEDGFYRISYLLVEAARWGIDVTVIGHTNAKWSKQLEGNLPDYDYEEYFTGHLDDDSYVEGKKVSDYMTFRKSYWNVNDRGGTDMMHIKTATVSHYLDENGVERGSAVWTSCINLDGVDWKGSNVNNGIQSGVIITDHDDLRRVICNYTDLMVDYCEENDVILFREIVSNRNKEQIDLILAGRGDEIDPAEQLVYLGSETDSVFEWYFTPFAGAKNTWNITYNPYSKYFSKLLPANAGDDYVELMWTSVKYIDTFPFAQTLVDVMVEAFEGNPNEENVLFLMLPEIRDVTPFQVLQRGVHGKVISVNKRSARWFHSKDFQMSYMEDGERQFISSISSLNFHSGAMYHQANSILIIKENETIGNDFYVDYANLLVPEVDHEDRRIPRR